MRVLRSSRHTPQTKSKRKKTTLPENGGEKKRGEREGRPSIEKRGRFSFLGRWNRKTKGKNGDNLEKEKPRDENHTHGGTGGTYYRNKDRFISGEGTRRDLGVGE